MGEAIVEYAVFLAEVMTLVIALVVTIAGIIFIVSRAKTQSEGHIEITKLNDKLSAMADALKRAGMNRKDLKAYHKQQKERAKHDAKIEKAGKSRVFVIDFHGDIKASDVVSLRELVTALIMVATPNDKVVVRLESGGGLVHAYGLAASQLHRLKEKGISLTVSVDKVAASGGYMMAAVADTIIAAPFAVIGSIGVLAQIPNFNRVLKEHNVEFEQLSAGKYKRTLTLFGENTEEGRRKMQADIEDTHELFKDYVKHHRAAVPIDEVATGEHWFATRALEKNLVDELKTSDDYLLEASQTYDVYEVKYARKKAVSERLSSFVSLCIERGLDVLLLRQSSKHLM